MNLQNYCHVYVRGILNLQLKTHWRTLIGPEKRHFQVQTLLNLHNEFCKSRNNIFTSLSETPHFI